MYVLKNSLPQLIKKGFLRFRPWGLAACLAALTSLLFLKAADIMQDSSRHVVNIKREWARGSGYIQAEPGRELVFFMGDSKIAAGLLPEAFDSLLDGRVKSYNTALPGLPLAPHYFWLKDYLENHEKEDYPDFIILRLKPAGWDFFHFVGYAVQGAGLSEIFQYYFITGDAKILGNYFFPMRFNFPLMKRFLVGQVYRFAPESVQEKIKRKYYENQKGRETYGHDWEFFFETQFVRPFERWRERKAFLEESRGRYDFREMQAQGGVLAEDYRYVKKGEWGESSEAGAPQDPFLEKFFELTRRHHIRVVLINDYLLPSQVEEEQTDGVPELWKELSRRYPHVSILPGAEAAQVYPNGSFSDPLHLTEEGAERFTSYIAGQFKKAFMGESKRQKTADVPASGGGPA